MTIHSNATPNHLWIFHIAYQKSSKETVAWEAKMPRYVLPDMLIALAKSKAADPRTPFISFVPRAKLDCRY